MVYQKSLSSLKFISNICIRFMLKVILVSKCVHNHTEIYIFIHHNMVAFTSVEKK